MIETSSEVDSHTEITLKEDEDGRSYDVFITPLIDNKNNLLGRLIVFRDVTTHLNNQVVLQQSNYELEGRVNSRTAELRASEERYALAACGTNDGIWDWDILNDRVHYSPRWKAMFGFEEDELGMSIDEWFLRVHPDDIQRVRAELAAHLHNETEDFSSEHRLMHKNGDYGWVLVRGVAIRDKDNIPERIAGSFSDITARKRIEEQLIHDALHDSLTGLPNRALLNDRLGRACQRARRSQDYRFALLYIDLDNFKVINDSLGHKYGDKVLIECSNRILNCLRNIDTVARIGGDEFVILIEEMDDYQNSRIAAERIQNAISLPMYLDGNIVYISASIGIRISHIIGESAEDFLRDADIAMYHAKGSGKSCYKEFDISMRDQAMERVQLENELRAALSHHEETQQLFVYYQPIISLEDGIISGFEALTRWRHHYAVLFLQRSSSLLPKKAG